MKFKLLMNFCVSIQLICISLAICKASPVNRREETEEEFFPSQWSRDAWNFDAYPPPPEDESYEGRSDQVPDPSVPVRYPDDWTGVKDYRYVQDVGPILSDSSSPPLPQTHPFNDDSDDFSRDERNDVERDNRFEWEGNNERMNEEEKENGEEFQNNDQDDDERQSENPMEFQPDYYSPPLPRPPPPMPVSFGMENPRSFSRSHEMHNYDNEEMMRTQYSGDREREWERDYMESPQGQPNEHHSDFNPDY